MIDILIGIIVYILFGIINCIIMNVVTQIGCSILGYDWFDVNYEITEIVDGFLDLEGLLDRGCIGTIILTIIVGVLAILVITGIYTVFIHPILVYKALISIKKEKSEEK